SKAVPKPEKAYQLVYIVFHRTSIPLNVRIIELSMMPRTFVPLFEEIAAYFTLKTGNNGLDVRIPLYKEGISENNGSYVRSLLHNPKRGLLHRFGTVLRIPQKEYRASRILR
ncbi:hypothetical protein, partial [Salibacterium salarium]|uniref:hypothetical protein n=1 Tax=Salibacterium salarium TaxID=284579 RepID=UPI001C8B339F